MLLTRQILQHLARNLTQPAAVNSASRCLSVKAQEVLRDSETLTASVHGSEQMVFVRENDLPQNAAMQFPGLWLRDNCLCDQCFHKESLSRKPIRWTNFDCDVKVDRINVDEKKNEIHIEWSDKHQSTFTLDWLKQRNFSKQHQEQYINSWYRPQPKCWNQNNFSKILKTFQYSEIMENDAGGFL